MRILLVTTRFPLPARRGQQVRTMEWLQALGDDHEVALVCPDGGAAHGLPSSVARYVHRSNPLAAGLGLVRSGFAGRPFQEGLYDTSSARSAVRRAVEAFRPSVLALQMVRCAWAVDAARAVDPKLPVVFDAIDSMGLHFRRRATVAPAIIRPLLRVEAARCHRREAALAAVARRTVAVATRDLAAMGHWDGVVVPVAGRTAPAGVVAAPTPTVALTGNLGYRPTVVAAQRFADTVWPEIRRRRPDALWVLAGARPHRRILDLDRRPGIEVLGEVPDLSAVLASAWVAVAPMDTGSGVPMKVLEAWAAEVPVVVHPWAAEGLDGSAREAVRVAESPNEWIERVTALLDSSAERRQLADRGLRVWRARYSPEAVAGAVRVLMAGLTDSAL